MTQKNLTTHSHEHEHKPALHRYAVYYTWTDSPYRIHTISNRVHFAGSTPQEAINKVFPDLTLREDAQNTLSTPTGLTFHYLTIDKEVKT